MRAKFLFLFLLFRLFSNGGLMYAQGKPVQVKRITNVTDSYPMLSPDGSLIVFQSNRSGNFEIYTIDTAGKNLKQLTFNAANDVTPVWSPDGKKIVFTSERDTDDPEIYIMNADGSSEKRLTNTPGDDSHPHWFPDGSRIIFNSSRTSPDLSVDWGDQFHELFTMKPDGSDVTQLTNFKAITTYPNVSPDGEYITFRHVTHTAGLSWDLSSSAENSEIFVMKIDGSNPINLSNNIAYDGWPCWSPDGQKIVFSSNRDGPASTGSLFIVNADGSGLHKIAVSGYGFAQPAWSEFNGKIYVYQYQQTPEYEYGNIACLNSINY